MHKALLILYLWIGLLFSANASPQTVKVGAEPHVEKVLHLDSSKVTIRNFDRKALERYAKDPNFNYSDAPKADDTWWDRFWRAFWDFIRRLFDHGDSSGSGGSPLGSLFLAVVVILIIYLIVRAIGLDNIFNREPKQVTLPYTESLENIHEITFDEQIEKVLAARNYKLAVRLLYLRSLKQLNDAGYIQWKIDKTNTEYLNELANSDYKQSFWVLTRQFEYVWYGDFPVDGQSFQSINDRFHDFKKMLS